MGAPGEYWVYVVCDAATIGIFILLRARFLRTRTWYGLVGMCPTRQQPPRARTTLNTGKQAGNNETNPAHRLSRGSMPFSPVTPAAARPPSRPGRRSAPAAEAAKAAERRCTSSIAHSTTA